MSGDATGVPSAIPPRAQGSGPRSRGAGRTAMGALSALARRTAFWLQGAAGRRRAAWVVLAAFAATWIAGVGLLLGRGVARGAAPAGGGALVIYLHAGTDEAVGRSLADEIRQLGGVREAEYVAPAQTLARLRRSLAGDEALLDGVEPAAMPASVEAQLQPGVEQVLPLSPTLAALRRHPAVEQVALDEATAEPLSTTLAHLAPWALRLQLAAAGLAALLGLALARLGWRTPRRELAVATLLGAGPAFHLIPAALAAALAAAAGALVGALTLVLSAGALAGALPALASLSSIQLLDGVDVALLAAAAMVLAALASAFAVAAHEVEA